MWKEIDQINSNLSWCQGNSENLSITYLQESCETSAILPVVPGAQLASRRAQIGDEL